MEWGLTAEDWSAIRLSLKVAGVATLASLPLATLVALALARGRFWGRALLDGVVHLPLVLPPVVTGFALLMLLGRRGALGAPLAEHFGIVFSFRWTGAALASAVMAFPLVVRSVRLAIEAVDPRLEEVSRTMGASPVATFFLVTLPLAFPGLLAGAVLCFAKALGEFGATITFVSAIPGETLTIPAAIYVATQQPGAEGRALALSAVAAVIALAALIVSEALARRARTW